MGVFARILLVVPLSLLLVGCGLNSEYPKNLYGPETSIEGGPIMEMVNDVEIWKHGKPEKDYEVIGKAEDKRSSKLDKIDSDIADKVKEKSGDGAYRVAYGLVQDKRTRPSLVINSVGGTPYSYYNPSLIIFAVSSKYEIFKYKD